MRANGQNQELSQLACMSQWPKSYAVIIMLEQNKDGNFCYILIIYIFNKKKIKGNYNKYNKINGFARGGATLAK